MVVTGCTPDPRPDACQDSSRPGNLRSSRVRAYGSSLAIIWSSAWSTFIHRVSSPGSTMS
jgi:hypothetical protein